MEIQEALQIVRKLADGIHPETGEVLQTDCLYQQPQVVRALHRAAGALEFQDERERAKKFLPANAGKSWSNQEDAFTALPSQSFDFTIAATPANVSVPAGQSALFSVDVAPTTAVFPNNVSLSCSKLPALTTCNFNPAQISSGSGESVLTLTLSTTKPITGAAKLVFAMLFPGLPFIGLFCVTRRKVLAQRHGIPGRLLLLLFAVSLCVSCGGLQGNGGGGGNGNPGTPPGTYNLTITATSGSITHSTQVTLTTP